MNALVFGRAEFCLRWPGLASHSVRVLHNTIKICFGEHLCDDCRASLANLDAYTNVSVHSELEMLDVADVEARLACVE